MVGDGVDRDFSGSLSRLRLERRLEAFCATDAFNFLLVQVSIRNANVHDSRFNKGLYIKYKPFRETEFTTTKTVKDTLSPEFDEKDSKVFGFDSVKQELLDWFDSGCITFQLMGRQEDSDPESSRKRMTTKVCVTRSCGLRDELGHFLRH